METTDPHISAETLRSAAPNEPTPDTYEPPSVTELGSYVELTAGTAGLATDSAGFSAQV